MEALGKVLRKGMVGFLCIIIFFKYVGIWRELGAGLTGQHVQLAVVNFWFIKSSDYLYD